MVQPDSPTGAPAPAELRPPAWWEDIQARLVTVLGLLALMGVAGAWRWTASTRSGLWRDEALTLAIIGAPDYWGYAFQHDSHPPLYYLINLLAWGAFGRSDTVSMGLSIAFGVALVPALFWAGRAAFTPAVGWIAAILAVGLPLGVEYAGMLRPYSLLPLLTLGCLFTLQAGLRHRHPGWWVAHVGFTVALLYVHNWGVLIAAAQGVVGVLYLLARRPGWPLAGLWAGAQLGVALLYAPWVPVLLEQARHAGHPPVPLVVPGAPGQTLDNLGAALQMFARSLTGVSHGVGAIALLGAALTGALAKARENEAPVAVFAGVPLVAFALAVGLSSHSNLLFEKCLLALSPAALLLMGYALTRYSPRTLLTISLVGALVLAHATATRQMLGAAKTNAREVATAVATQIRPDDLVIVAPEWIASSFNLYFPSEARQIVFPHVGKRTLVSFRDVAARLADPQAFLRASALVRQQRAAGGRVWLVVDMTGFQDGSPLPPTLELPPGMNPRDYYRIGHLRSRQLAAEVAGFYGEPRWVSPPTTRALSLEAIAAMRFDPPATPGVPRP